MSNRVGTHWFPSRATWCCCLPCCCRGWLCWPSSVASDSLCSGWRGLADPEEPRRRCAQSHPRDGRTSTLPGVKSFLVLTSPFQADPVDPKASAKTKNIGGQLSPSCGRKAMVESIRDRAGQPWRARQREILNRIVRETDPPTGSLPRL